MKSCVVIILMLLVMIVASGCSKKLTVQNEQSLQQPEQSQRNIIILDRDDAIESLPEIEGWTTYVDEQNGFLMMHPEGFLIQNEIDLVNFDDSDEENEPDEGETIQVEILRQTLHAEFKSFEQFKQQLMEIENDLTEPAKEVNLGDYVVLSQYFSYGSSGEQYNSFISHGFEENEYFEIKVFEPGFSENREVVEKAVETFMIFR